MKWIIALIAFSMPMMAECIKADCTKQQCEPTPIKCIKPPPPLAECEPDLFNRDDQIYSGSVEFLYWSVAEGSLDYALKMRHDAWGPSASFAQGRYEKATYDIDPGVRLGLLYYRAPHRWEVRWSYTRMTNRGKNHSEKPGPDQQFLTGTWPQITTLPIASAHSRIHLNYNVFEYSVDRVFFPNPHLRLRVFGGAILSWMDQDWKVRYQDSVPHITTIRNRWHYVGAGIKSGTLVDWYWTGDLYLTGGAFFGTLMGSYSNRAKQTTTFQPTANDNTDVPVRDTSYKDVRPACMIQMLLGPAYQKNYAKTRLELFAGFEMTSWFNLQEIYRSTSGGPSVGKETRVNASLLSLYGLTSRVSLDF